ncbi:MAG: S8 family serine peptidase [Gaiellaceae bacterium]
MKRLRIHLMVVTGVAALAALIPSAQAGRWGGHGHSPDMGDPWGTLVIRFAAGTSDAQMQDTVRKMGGSLVVDMPQINAVAAIGKTSEFGSKIGNASSVRNVFKDKQVQIRHTDTSHQGRGQGRNHGSDGGDPWHAQYQWDDASMDVPAAWAKATGRGVKVAVVDSGIERNREINDNYIDGKTFIPCRQLNEIFGRDVVKELQLRDCGMGDKSGHGTWISTRIAGERNGFASNGIAPDARILDRKVLAGPYTIFDSSWAMAAMLDACDSGADVVNLSLIVYDDPLIDSDAQDYLLWKDAVDYCRAKGAVVVAGAGNDHVRINRVDTAVGGESLNGVGIVDSGDDGIGLTGPGEDLYDLRGLLPAPAGVPGVVMVSATNRVTEDAGDVPNRFPASVTGAEDQLAYYSNYGSRVDLAAPGGSRAYNLPSYDAGDGDVYGASFGVFSSLSNHGYFCTDVPTDCFKERGTSFGWMEGTSMATGEISGVFALVLSAHPSLRDKPDALLALVQSTARSDMENATGPMDAGNTSDTLLGPCPDGFCHLDFGNPISFSDAYGAGIPDAAKAVTGKPGKNGPPRH